MPVSTSIVCLSTIPFDVAIVFRDRGDKAEGKRVDVISDEALEIESPPVHFSPGIEYLSGARDFLVPGCA